MPIIHGVIKYEADGAMGTLEIKELSDYNAWKDVAKKGLAPINVRLFRIEKIEVAKPDSETWQRIYQQAMAELKPRPGE